MRFKKLFIGLSAATAAVGIGVGVAAAQWSASGTGSGAGGATIAKNLVVSSVNPTGAAATLYPGGPAGPVYLTIQNPNPYGVTVTNLNWGTPTSTSTSTCPTSQVSLDANAPTTGFSISVPANTTTAALQINSVLDLAHTAPDGCQGVTFLVPVTAIGVQQ